MSKFPSSAAAAILVAQNSPLVVDEIHLPSDLSFGQVLVRVSYSGICGSQMGEIDGAKGPDPHLPHLLGHEGSGEVVAVGTGVTTVAQEDRVVLHWRPGAGLQGEVPHYRWNGHDLNAGSVTTFNEYAVISENRMTTVPEGVAMDTAALLGCAVTTGFGVVTRDAGLAPGESIVVFGTGGVGLSVIQAAACLSAFPIVAVDLVGSRLALAEEVGATVCVNRANFEELAAVRNALGTGTADVCVDTTGNPQVIEDAIDLAGPTGRVVLVGVPGPESAVRIHTLQLHFGKRIAGSHGGGAMPASDIPRLAKLIRTGRLDLTPLITDLVTLGGINRAIEAMRSGKAKGRCLIDLGGTVQQ